MFHYSVQDESDNVFLFCVKINKNDYGILLLDTSNLNITSMLERR